MEKGTVSFYNPEKEYGFIEYEDSEEVIYFERADVRGNIQDGDEVFFHVGEGEKGKQAKEIHRAPPPLPPGYTVSPKNESPDFF